MPDTIGPHLLGRIPSPPDARDFRLENFVGIGDRDAGTADPVALAQLALDELKLTTVTYKRWASSAYVDISKTHWYKALNALLQITAQPVPPTTGKEWLDAEAVLDQGDYGTCVGNGCAQWGNTLPIDDKFVEKDARALYYEATILDGYPDDPDGPGGGQQGATVRSGVKALQNRKRLAQYARASTIAAIEAWVLDSGPVIIGSDWMNSMFNPDASGFVIPSGGVAGGHCYLLLGYIPEQDAFEFLNSWGSSWGKGGYFYMKTSDFQGLLANGGEAWTAVELAL